MPDLKGRHVFVLGGSRGIGAQAARHAASCGAAVGLTFGRSAGHAERLVEEIRTGKGQAQAFEADVQKKDSVGLSLESSVKAFGPLDGLVVSAGIFEHQDLENMELDFWNRVLSINLTGTFLAVQAAIPHMKRNGGSIVIYTSTAGQSGSGNGASAYATSKGGQILFMKSAAQELGKYRIRVNCIAPAWTETDMAAPHLDRMGREQVAQNFPLGRIGKPEDVAQATSYLLSGEASFITGVTLTVDGGMAMRG